MGETYPEEAETQAVARGDFGLSLLFFSALCLSLPQAPNQGLDWLVKKGVGQPGPQAQA